MFLRTKEGSLRATRASRPTVTAVLLAIGIGAVAWARLPGVARDTFWAEDGRDFIQAALDDGWRDLLAPYGGYLHLVPRMLAGLAVTAVPVEGYALFMSAASSLVAGLCGAVVWCTSRQHVRPGWAILIAVTTVLAPLAAREVLGNAANLHTIMMWSLFWVLLYTPVRVRTATLLAVFATLAALTEVQTVFLLPLLAWRFRHPLRRIVFGGYLVGVLAQLVCVVASPRKQTAFGHVEPLSYPYGFVINAIMPLVLPFRAVGPVLAVAGVLVAVLLVVAVAVLIACLLRGSAPATRLIVTAALALAVLSFVAGVHTTPLDLYDYAAHSSHQLRRAWLARYGVLPSMLIIGAICVAAGAGPRRRRAQGRLRGGVTTAVAVAVVVSFVVHFVPADTRRSHGPAWMPQVLAARQGCGSQDEDAVVLRQTLGWNVTVPCDRLR